MLCINTQLLMLVNVVSQNCPKKTGKNQNAMTYTDWTATQNLTLTSPVDVCQK